MSFFDWTAQDKVFYLIDKLEYGFSVDRDEILDTLYSVLDHPVTYDLDFREALEVKEICQQCSYKDDYDDLEAKLTQTQQELAVRNKRKIQAEW